MNTLRYAWRSLAKSPGFVVISVLALGLGLGLSTTMFAVLDAVVNPEVAYRDPGTLFQINWWFGQRNPMTPVELYRFFRDQTRSFEAVVPVAWDEVEVTIDVDGQQRDVSVRRVTPRWFIMTGIKPKMGRGLVASDGEGAVVLSYDLWNRIFGQRRVLDSAFVTIGGRPTPVVGVLPRGAGRAGAWMALPANIEGAGITAATVRPFARLRAGLTREEADREIKTLARLLTGRFGAREAPFAFELYPAINTREEVKDIHKAMIGAALTVLLIACVNLAHLMLARGLAKRREFALRMALGASRGAVVRQMFTECAIITVAGASLGAPGVSVRIMAWNSERKAEIASRGFLAKVFVAMGAVALGLSAMGLYGVLAYNVTRRMREFAVRIALGAEPKRLLRMVLHDGFVMLLAGIGVGAFGALLASRMLDSVLIAVLPSDVVTLVISEAVLITAGLAAAFVPARRASRANPMDILRAT